MNIQYRGLSSVSVNLQDRKDRLMYFQGHYYDNVYFLGPLNHYEGHLSLVDEPTGDVKYLYVDRQLNGPSATEWFRRHPGVFRVPFVVDGIMYGEYFDADSVGPCLYQTIEERALKIAHCFETELNDALSGKRIGICGPRESYEQANSIFASATWSARDDKDVDIIVDLELATHFRELLYGKDDRVCSMSELLFPILVERLSSFYQTKDVGFLAVDGLMMSDIGDRALFPNSERTIEDLLQDTFVIHSFCGSDLDSLNFIKTHEYDLNQISKIVFNGIHNVLLDSRELGFNIVDGKRMTLGTPDCASRSIHVFGPCIVQGLCVVDSQTIPSLLQRILHENGFDDVRVENHGLAYGKDLLNDLMYMMATPVSGGDIVVWFSGFSEKEERILANCSIPVMDAKQLALGMIGGMLNNPFHCNAESNRTYALRIFQHLSDWLKTTHSCFEPEDLISHYGIPLFINPDAILDSHELRDYIRDIVQYDFHQPSKTKGCVVVNANPCTNGHIYLIEEALKRVDLLYVFLVEESKGSFSYLDREYMLAENYKDNPRVRIVSGGRVLTSALGFPEYFNRGAKPKRIDPILNHKIFALRIAPALGITHRFFGSEPFDEVTRELNRTALHYLPRHGVSVTIIERATAQGSIISAKTVRELYSLNKFYEIAGYVPRSTFSRLLELSSVSIDKLEYPLEQNGISYPGMFKKFGVTLDGVNYMLKIADTPERVFGLYCERIGGILCRQLNVESTCIRLVDYGDDLALISRSWEIDEDAQFFPLASFFEALIERYGQEVVFSYSTFKDILRSKCPDTMDHVLDIFWRVSIIDYLLCNARSAGNLGFIDNGKLTLTPIYDNSTWLRGIDDQSYLDVYFPQLLMRFGLDDNSAYTVFKSFDDRHMDAALSFAAERIDIEELKSNVTSVEERYLIDVVSARFDKLFSK